MNRRIVFIAVMLLVIASMGIVLFILNNEQEIPRETSSAAPAIEEYIYNTENYELNFITVLNSHGEYTLTVGDDIVIKGHEDLPLDIFNIFHILDVSGKLGSRGVITEEADNYSIFGLDPPQAQVYIQPQNGEAVSLFIGSSAPDGGVYVKLGGSMQVNLASYSDVRLFLSGFLELIDTSITPSVRKNQSGAFIFEKIILGGRVREEISITNSAPVNDVFAHIASPYQIIIPVNIPVSIEKTSVIESLFGLKAGRAAAVLSDDVITRREELNRYGLSQPWSTAEAAGSGADFRILVSKPDGAGKVNILREGTTLIYEAAASNLPWLEVSYFELMDRMVFIPFIDNVASVEIKTPERSITFSLSTEGGALSVNAGSVDIDVGNFRAFYQTLVGTRYDEYSDISAISLPPPFLEIIYNYRSRGISTDIVSFHQASSRRVLTSLNHSRPFFTHSVYTDKILSDLDLVLAGRRVRAYL